jgi:hypothetical protein
MAYPQRRINGAPPERYGLISGRAINPVTSSVSGEAIVLT